MRVSKVFGSLFGMAVYKARIVSQKRSNWKPIGTLILYELEHSPIL